LVCKKTRRDVNDRRNAQSFQFRSGLGSEAALTIIEGEQAERPGFRSSQSIEQLIVMDKIEPPAQGVDMTARLGSRQHVLIDDDSAPFN
jgi:hypothetical protein